MILNTPHSPITISPFFHFQVNHQMAPRSPITIIFCLPILDKNCPFIPEKRMLISLCLHPPPFFFVCKFTRTIDWTCVWGQAAIGFAHGPNDKLSSRTTAELALPQKIFEPTVWGNKIRLPALFPRKFGLQYAFTFPAPAAEPTLLRAATPFWVGWPAFDWGVGAGDRKRNLPDIHGVL